jgi:hypothetical protein
MGGLLHEITIRRQCGRFFLKIMPAHRGIPIWKGYFLEVGMLEIIAFNFNLLTNRLYQ